MSKTDLKPPHFKLNRLSLVPLIKIIKDEEQLVPQDSQEWMVDKEKARSPIEYLRGSNHKKRITSQATNMLSISTNHNSNLQIKSSTIISNDVCFYQQEGFHSPSR